MLFTGSIRFNLSPFGEDSDADIWRALRRAHLAAVVESHPDGLDMVLSEGGAPLSAGQKQLVALARALLRHSKVCEPPPPPYPSPRSLSQNKKQSSEGSKTCVNVPRCNLAITMSAWRAACRTTVCCLCHWRA